MTTWGQVLAGDVVRGADQRGWTVVGVAPASTWVGSGRATVHLALSLDGRRVTTTRGVAEPVDLIACGDHRGPAAACQALINSGFTVTILEDRLDAHR